MKYEVVEYKKQANQETIRLYNQSTLLSISDEEMGHVCISSNESS